MQQSESRPAETAAVTEVTTAAAEVDGSDDLIPAALRTVEKASRSPAAGLASIRVGAIL